MRINKFILGVFLAFALMTILLSFGFYSIERILLLHTVADSLDRSSFLLEDDIQRLLRNHRREGIQALVDRAPAINKAMAEVAVSLDGKNIYASSSRSRTGKAIESDYIPITVIDRALIKDSHTSFSSEFYYFEGAAKHKALLLIRVDKKYVFGRLERVAFFYGGAVFLFMSILGFAVLALLRRQLVAPLEKVTQHARNASSQGGSYFITELAQLDHALSESFSALKKQKDELQVALDETKYLDSILQTIADVNQLLISSSDAASLLAAAANRLAKHADYSLCWIALVKDGKIEIQAFSSDMTGLIHTGLTVGNTFDASNNLAARAINECHSIMSSQINAGIHDDESLNIAQKGGFQSFIAIPLLASLQDEAIGILGIYKASNNLFVDKEVGMLEELAGDIGFAARSFEQREQLAYHLSTDPVTNLPNRVSLIDALQENKGGKLAIINIDRFGDINEIYGVKIGDGLLAAYGSWLSDQVSSDKGIRLYKGAGDEYVLLFNESMTLNQCIDLVENLIQQTAKEVFDVGDVGILITITAGIAEDAGRMLSYANVALKQAKTQRKSIQVYANAPSRSEHESNIAWYKRIKSAIEDSRIVPYFQPIVDNQTCQIIRYEALVRMIEENGTVISPLAFLDIAKKTRLYGQITKIVVEKTCEAFMHSTIPVSINLSTEDLLDSHLADMLETAIMSRNMGQLVSFEILESEGIENYAEVSRFVDRFKSLGCRFSIDDFGSGYSNFDHLLRLNIDTLKIDGSLIKNLPHDHNAQIFVRHIRDFAAEVGISTVAEYVANEEIYQQVKKIGIDASQGYYFYPPSAELVTADNEFPPNR